MSAQERNGINPLTQADFYKTGHIFQYPEGTELVYSNFTPRSARLAPVIPELYDGKVVWFGLQGFIKSFLIDLWNRNFFGQPKEQVVSRYRRRLDTALGPGAVPVDHIERLWDLGYLPLEIRALPEGSRVDIGVPALTVINTDPDFYWLTNYIETVLSNELWKPTTTATIAFEYRKLLTAYARLTGAPEDFVSWQGHDFSARGMSGMADAMQAGAGHLLSFTGTDTISAIDYLEDWYNADADRELIGGSVPATEHSVMCMGGLEDELETFRRLITEVYPSGIVSIVSDTWDFFRVITDYASRLKEEIENRRPDALGNAKVVFRPDSGDPVDILTGEAIEVADLEAATLLPILKSRAGGRAYARRAGEFFELFAEGDAGVRAQPVAPTPSLKGAVECLWEVFGGSLSAKGYRMLNPRVGLIYGDSITLLRAQAILSRLAAKGFASSNVVLGIGSYTYQYLTRDSFGWAMKATWGVVRGEARELFKDPVTDSGTKRSARGLLRVEKEQGRYRLFDRQSPQQAAGGELLPVFRNGNLLVDASLAEIRERLMASWVPDSISSSDLIEA
jgi:nicotinamide phosphoribosyltransferase